MNEKVYVAADLGAGSGRVIAGRFDGSRLRFEETNRFENTQTPLPGGLHWDMVALYRNILEGIRRARALGSEPVSVGVDAWGVDYALVDAAGRLAGLPHSYRDPRLDGVMEETCAKLGRRRIYDATGTQFMPINTLFQLMAESRSPASQLDRAARFLMVPDLMDYWLSGVLSNEVTIASTSQCLDVRTRDWAWGLLDAAGLPRRLFGELVRPGTVLGPVRGLEGYSTKVVAVGTHDTASAVAAIPVPKEGRWGCLSTGTWGLVGAEIPEPIFSDEAYERSWTNEIGITGGIRFMKNLTGMWIYQELHRAWKAQGKEVPYDRMTEMAARAKPFVSLIDPDAPDFQRAGHMDEKIAAWCKRTGQPVPESKGAFARCALESMVLRYRELWSQLERITGERRDGLNMIGGATRNALHCRMAADALGVPVLCGPTEGACAGNVLVQMIATGDLRDHAEARELMGVSDPPVAYEPSPAASAAWAEAAGRFESLKSKVESRKRSHFQMARAERFEELEVWQRSRELTKDVYRLSALASFAKDFGLRDQIRRASVSILSNIAEGFERNSDADFGRFLLIAKGFAGEVRAQLYVALDQDYLDERTFLAAKEKVESVSRLLSRLIAYLRHPPRQPAARDGSTFRPPRQKEEGFVSDSSVPFPPAPPSSPTPSTFIPDPFDL